MTEENFKDLASLSDRTDTAAEIGAGVDQGRNGSRKGRRPVRGGFLRRRQISEQLYRRRFIVPNVVTLANMFCGFLSCIYSASGRFEKAAIALGIAILLDGLDGRLARSLNATSKFGLEFDSFSDLISFGLAPGLLIYHWAFKPVADELGVLFCFVFALCAATRLARFNISVENLRGFQGLPTPGAAGMVAATVNLWPQIEASSVNVALAAVLMLGLGVLMVSNLPFISIKLIKFSGLRFLGQIGLGALIALSWYNSGVALMILATGYVSSGPLVSFLRWQKARSESTAQTPAE